MERRRIACPKLRCAPNNSRLSNSFAACAAGRTEPFCTLKLHDSGSFCALTDRLFAHRQRAHLHLQLAVRSQTSRHMVLRIDDTDVDRNTEASLNSIYEGLNWLGLGGTSSTGSPSVWIFIVSSRSTCWRRARLPGFHAGDRRSGRQAAWGSTVAMQSRDAGAFEGGEREARGRRRAVCDSLSRGARAGPTK